MNRRAKVIGAVVALVVVRGACAVASPSRAPTPVPARGGLDLVDASQEAAASSSRTIPMASERRRTADDIADDVRLLQSFGRGLPRDDLDACLALNAPARDAAVALRHEAVVAGHAALAVAALRLIPCLSCGPRAGAACARVDEALR